MSDDETAQTNQNGAGAGLLTCVQQLLHHLEVGVRHAVVQRRVAVAVRHVDDVAQHGRRDGLELPEEVVHHDGERRLLAGDAEPLVLQRVDAGPLREGRGSDTTAGQQNLQGEAAHQFFTAHSVRVVQVGSQHAARRRHLLAELIAETQTEEKVSRFREKRLEEKPEISWIFMDSNVFKSDAFSQTLMFMICSRK